MKLTRNGTALFRRSRGFTLLEVLVALVIVGLGMIAVFEQLNQMLTTTARLRDKTFATWIAEDRITELQVNGQYPDVGERRDELEMARAEWTYTIKVSQIPGREMRRVDVTVSYADTPNDILAEVAGFVSPYQGKGPTGTQQRLGSTNADGVGTGFGIGWAPLDQNAGFTESAVQ